MTERTQDQDRQNAAGTDARSRLTRLSDGDRDGPSDRTNGFHLIKDGKDTRLTLEVVTAQVRHLPALPVVAMRVMQLTGDTQNSAREVALAISRDPSFAARILQMANSAYYGLPRSVGTISEAVVLLGMRTVRNIAIAAATRDLLSRELSGYALGRGDLWRHSMATAICARGLAESTRRHDPEEAFVAGLLHDIGKIVMSLYVGEAYAELQARMETDNLSFLEAERATFGFDHAEVGGIMAKKWNLPTQLTEAIAHHHEPMQDGKVSSLAAVVHIANVICLFAGIGIGADGLRTNLCDQALIALGMTEHDVESALDLLVTHVAQSQPLFENYAPGASVASRGM